MLMHAQSSALAGLWSGTPVQPIGGFAVAAPRLINAKKDISMFYVRSAHALTLNHSIGYSSSSNHNDCNASEEIFLWGW